MSERPFPWRTLLFVSAAINLLILGAALGAFGAGVRLERQGAGEAVVERMPSARAFVAALPEETRPVIRAELARSWVQSRDARREALQARRDAFEAAAAEPFDAEAVRAAFARLREADQRAIGVFHDNVVSAFAAMTPEQRREALAALRQTAPAARQPGAAPVEEPVGPALDPSDREMRREKFRERVRQRLRERREGRP